MSLYLIPTFISENTGTLPETVMEKARRIDEFVVENEKSARAFLKMINSHVNQKDFIFHLLNEHTGEKEISALAEIFRKEKDIGLLSEAGCPGVADPGAAIVKIAHEKNIRVVPLTGPSSIILALMASGMNGQSFIFHGYLPRDSAQRRRKITAMENEAVKKGQTQIFIEAPYRNKQLLEDILISCSGTTLLCIACNVTSSQEKIETKKISQWKKSIPEINKMPVIFLIGT